MLCASVVLWSGNARADVGRTRGSAQVEQQVGVNLDGPVFLHNLNTSTPARTGPASVLAVTSASPASLTVRGGALDAISLSVPALLDLGRAGGLETLQMRLGSGTLGDGATLLSSSGGVSLRLVGDVKAPVNPVVPGDYRGLLVIVAQWN